MSDSAPPPVPPDTAPQPKKPGFLTRLFGPAGSASNLRVAIAPFVDAAGVDHAQSLASVFNGLKGLHVTKLRKPPVLTPEVPRTEALPAACAQAMNWITQHDVDVVLWGDIPPPGTTLFIHFAAPPPRDEDPAGTISPFQALNLPVGFDGQDLGALLLASTVAAMNPKTTAKRQIRHNLVADALERAADTMEHLPIDFTSREQASVQAMFGNALAAFGHLFPGTEVYHRASLAYVKAIQGTLRDDSPTNWAYLHRNLGTVLQALGERSNDTDTLERAATAYRAALEVFTQDITPFPWATTQIRLGLVMHRLDIKNSATDGLKQVLAIYQSALKVLTKRATPLLWSETMNNLGETAQVLGRELGNEEVLKRAVEAYRQALSVRRHDTQPTLWAQTQNNMGSALFVLGRSSRNNKYFEEALNAFMGAREVYGTLGLTRMVEITEKNIAHAEESLPNGRRKAAPSSPGSKSGPGTKSAMWWLDDEDNGPNGTLKEP